MKTIWFLHLNGLLTGLNSSPHTVENIWYYLISSQLPRGEAGFLYSIFFKSTQ